MLAHAPECRQKPVDKPAGFTSLRDSRHIDTMTIVNVTRSGYDNSVISTKRLSPYVPPALPGPASRRRERVCVVTTALPQGLDVQATPLALLLHGREADHTSERERKSVE
jgi:hypothetical protein